MKHSVKPEERRLAEAEWRRRLRVLKWGVEMMGRKVFDSGRGGVCRLSCRHKNSLKINDGGMRNIDDELRRGSGGELDGCRASSWRSGASLGLGNLGVAGDVRVMHEQRDRGCGAI